MIFFVKLKKVCVSNVARYCNKDFFGEDEMLCLAAWMAINCRRAGDCQTQLTVLETFVEETNSP